MSLFNRKSFLDGDGFRQVVSISLPGINDIVNVGSFGLVPDITGEDAAATAAAQANAGSNAAIASQERQFDLTRADLLPFLEAATGQGGALDQFIAGIDQGPTAPQLNQFDEQFSFDPNSALNNPNLQFLREQGNIAADRVAGKNRNLGSGNRLLAAQEFGQGLSSNFLNDEYNRQFNEFNQRSNLNTQENNRLLQQHSLGLQSFNDRLNRLGGLIDTGRGTGGTLGTIGANSASNIGNLQQNIGNANASATLAANQGINSLVNTGITAAGYALGGPAGGAAAGAVSPANTNNFYSPIGAQDAQGFF